MADDREVGDERSFISHLSKVAGEVVVRLRRWPYVLQVTRRPPVRIAHLEHSVGVRPSLLEEILDELVDDLRGYKVEEEEHALEFTAEEEVAEEAVEVDEYWDEGNPNEEVIQLVAAPVLDVSQRHDFGRRRNHGGGFWELGIANGVLPDLGWKGKDFCDGLESV
ncbi:hypothetical protein ACFX13_009867 [Malus domestica]